MESILKELYLLLGAGAVMFTLTGGAIGYYIIVWKCGKTYKKYFLGSTNDKIKNDIKFSVILELLIGVTLFRKSIYQ